MTKTTKGSSTLNVLLTGCTSQQCNPVTNRNAINFAGVLRTALQLAGHEVYWQAPSISWKARELFARYDYVIVGLSPITSLSANRVYGALSVLGQTLGSNANKVAILLDAPEPERITASFRAILAHPQNIAKTFYAYRKEYELAVRQQNRLLGVVERLHVKSWPTTIMPQLPWESDDRTRTRLPYAAQRLVPLNLDRVLFDLLPRVEPRPRREIWAAEGRPQQATSLPRQPIARKGHAATDVAILEQMAGSVGTLVELSRDGTWWNTRYAQSLSIDTPIFSDWRDTASLGSAWSLLPMNIETMSQAERDEVALAQRSQYLKWCPDESQVVDQITQLLRTRAKTSILA